VETFGIGHRKVLETIVAEGLADADRAMSIRTLTYSGTLCYCVYLLLQPKLTASEVAFFFKVYLHFEV
jgi:hypothetical protein